MILEIRLSKPTITGRLNFIGDGIPVVLEQSVLPSICDGSRCKAHCRTIVIWPQVTIRGLAPLELRLHDWQHCSSLK